MTRARRTKERKVQRAKERKPKGVAKQRVKEPREKETTGKLRWKTAAMTRQKITPTKEMSEAAEVAAVANQGVRTALVGRALGSRRLKL